MHLEPGTRIERWVVEAHVASGGMASVYLVRHEALGSAHALKVLHPEFGSFEGRLLGEGRAQSSLVHPHIVPVTDVVTVEGRLGLIMEWVDGPSLADWSASHRPTADQLDMIGRGLLRALTVAHEAGWVHRDLKPANVLLQITGDALVPKISDFGIAKRLEREAGVRTQAGRMFGTPAYMAPEQMRDAANVDARADLFALGVVLYELAAGFRPFPGSEPMVIFAAMSKPPPPLRNVAPNLPERFYLAIRSALAVDREERVPSAPAMIDAWTRDGDRPVAPPSHPWGAADLEAARRVQPPPSTPTWTPPSDTAREPRSTGMTLGPRARGIGAGVVVGLGLLLGLIALYLLRPVVPDGPPVVSDRPEVQRRFLLGWEQWADARFRSAEQTFSAVALDADDSPTPHLMLASTHIARQWWEPAMDALDAAKERLKPDDVAMAGLIEAYRRSVGGLAVDQWAELAQAHPRNLLVQVAACVELAGRDAAQAACRKARRLDDMAILDWIDAEIALNSFELDRAEGRIEAFLTRSPEHPRGLAQMSRLHAAAGRWEEARVWAERAVVSDPQSPQPRYVLARALANLGDDEGRRAQMVLATSPAQEPTDRILAVTADAYTSFGLGQTERSFEELRHAAALAREQRDWYSLSLAASVLGQFAWYLRDGDVLAESREALGEASAAPEVQESNAQRMRVAWVYMQGLEAALRRDAPKLAEARDRLAGLREAWSGWLPRDDAVTVLTAFLEAQRGDESRLLEIALHAPGCEIDYYGGAYLLDHGEIELGAERLRRTEETCRAWGPEAYFRSQALERLAEPDPTD